MKSISFHSKLILFTLALLALPMSCKDDDSKPDDGETTETVEVYQSQVVTIELPSDVELDEYEAKLGDITLPVVKFNENTIAFQVPSSYTPGEAEFKLPDLDLDIHYDIKETTLTQSAGETLAPFINEINQVSDEIAEEDTEEAEYLRNVITEFNGYYESLPEADKLTMAKYYKVNSELFNDILHPDLNGESGRINEIMDIADKYDVHVIAFGTGVALLLLAPDPAEKTAGALLSILAWKYSRGGLRELMAAGLDTVKVGFGSVWSNKNEDTTDEAISFTSGEPYTAALNMQRRNATTANQNSGTEGFTNFFYSLDILSTAVDKLNGVIQFVNDYVFFANISLVPVFTMPSENPLMTEPAEADSYGALQFSVADSGVEIGNISFQDGEINITLNVLNGEDFIETTLNYTYDDYFSHFSGSFPIEITSACANSNLEVTATANGNTATATASGGVSPYTYSWSNGATGATITGLEPGIYVVTATDASGCTAIASVMIEESDNSIDLSGTWIMEFTTMQCSSEDSYFSAGDNMQFTFNESNQTVSFVNGSVHPYQLNGNELAITINDQFDYGFCEDILALEMFWHVEINVNYDSEQDNFSGTYTDEEQISEYETDCTFEYTPEINCNGYMKIYRQ